jgi:formate dehydrogenase beta subunit
MNNLPLGLVVDLRTVVPYQTGSWRTMQPLNIMQTPPCSHSCPINNDIRGFLRTLADKQDFDEAWHVLTRTNPLPATCGRVCPHPCEGGCNRRDFDHPLAINSAERAVGDYGLEKHLEHKKLIPKRKEKVAVIGSGPAGLSCAFHLAKRGFQVKIFEAKGEPGGMMRYGIPSYRLPKEILNREIDAILRLGIDLECNAKVGVNIPMDQLIQFYDAVFMGPGAQLGLPIGVPGEEARDYRGDR